MLKEEDKPILKPDIIQTNHPTLQSNEHQDTHQEWKTRTKCEKIRHGQIL